jgi:hypothetical protein
MIPIGAPQSGAFERANLLDLVNPVDPVNPVKKILCLRGSAAKSQIRNAFSFPAVQLTY